MAFVKQYSKKKDGSIFITPNFKVSEFACHDGTDKVLIDHELVYLLQLIRSFMNVPININSGYRTQSYNRKIGGASRKLSLISEEPQIAAQIIILNLYI